MALVLVVEDNLEHQQVIAEVVRRLGHDVVVADDGHSGIAAAHARRPELVITDVDMPGANGIELCRAVRDGSTPAPAVIVITAYLHPDDPTVSQAGAAAVVRKPFTLAELVDAVRANVAGPPPAAPVPEVRDEVPGCGAAFATAAFVEALLQSVDTGVAACDADGRLVVFNKALQELFGTDGRQVPLEQWPHRFTLCHYDGEPLRVDELPLARALAGQEVVQADMLAHDRAGRPRWFAVNARPIRDPGDGRTLGAVAAVHDVTEAHQTRRYRDCETAVLKVLSETPDAASAGRRALTAIAETLGWPYLALWLVDPVAERLHRAATFTAPGERPLPVPETFALGEALPGVCWERGEPVWVPDIRAPGSPVLPEVAAACTYTSSGATPVRSGERTIGVLTFFAHDRQEPEPALAILVSAVAGHIGGYLERRRAEELSLQLAASTDEYIALVGHELRTPLTSIAAYAELIAEAPPATPAIELKDMLDVVLRNTTILRALVDQLLDLAALESRHADLEDLAVDLTGVVAGAVEAAGAAAGRRRIRIDTELHPGVAVPGDRGRLRQVVDHLLGNAVTYSPDAGTVAVALAAGPTAATLTVTDNGIGVPESERGRVFQRMYRASNARHNGFAGVGLGLTLSRAIVERHRGVITLAPGRPAGTTVTVRLPTSPA